MDVGGDFPPGSGSLKVTILWHGCHHGEHQGCESCALPPLWAGPVLSTRVKVLISAMSDSKNMPRIMPAFPEHQIQYSYGITESQNSLGWKGPLNVIKSKHFALSRDTSH